jgi:hypothetical protein
MHAKAQNLEEFKTSPQPTVLFDKEKTGISREKHVSFVADDKENSGANNISVSNFPVARVEAVAARKSPMDSFRSAELNRLRASYQSPQRRDLVEKTQVAIKNATASVFQSLNKTHKVVSINQSLNAARKAKEESLKHRVSKTKSVRFQWKEEKAEAKSFHGKVEENRRQIIALQRKLASAHFKLKGRSDDGMKKMKLSKLEQEYTFNSEVYRDHQQKLKNDKDRDRKKSIETRTKLRQNRREGEEKMKRMKEREEAAIFDVKYDLYKSRNDANRLNAENRRKSFQFRAGDAKRIRDIRSMWKEDDLQEQHKNYELSRAADKDVEAHKEKLAERRRESLQNRNLAGRNRRQLEREQKEGAMEAEHESYLLKWAGEKDVETYKKRMQEARRKSLVSRNKESSIHANVMQELKSLAQEKEAESFMLKWAGENDGKAYLAQLADERRKSLQFRGVEAQKHRLLKQEQHGKEVQKSLAEANLKSDCKLF